MQKKKMFANTVMSLLNQCIAIICGLILPKLFLIYYGSAVNGLISSITQFLSFVTFIEMGIGAVVQSNLYKPLADNDTDLLSRIMISARKFYKIIAAVFSVYIVLLCFFYPLMVRKSFDFIFTVSLILIISISMLMQYYFGIVNQILLNSDQKAYIPLFLQSITLFINTLVCYLLMKNGYGIQIVKLGTAAIYLLRPIGMYLYVNKKYIIDYSLKIENEPIQQKWNGVAQHLAAMVLEHTDVVVLTLFSTLESVSIYTVYYNVVCGIRRVFSTVIDSIRATFGRLIAQNDQVSLCNYFKIIEYIFHFVLSVIFGCTYALIIPFVRIYTKGINDTSYILPTFGFLITSAYLFYCIRVFYNMPVLAAGKYKETQNASFIECGINLITSIILVSKVGLIGVAIGTLLAMVYRVCYLIWYLSDNIVKRKITYSLNHLLVDMMAVFLTMILSSQIEMRYVTYIWWFIEAGEVFLICILVTFGLHIIFYKVDTVNLLHYFQKKN